MSVVLGLALVGSAGSVVATEPMPSPESVAAPSPGSGAVPGAEASLPPEPGSEQAPEPTPRPTLPDDLRKRKAPDVPLFVGPARLRVSGARGAHRWDEVRFGAQEAQTRIVLTPGGQSCAAHVRLIEDGQPVFSHWSSAPSGVTEVAEVILDVDYATGRLKVDSDCKHWSVRFAPLPDPDLELTLDQRFYTVRGDTFEELVDETTRIKGKWAAYTEWYTNWAFLSEEGEDLEWCDIVGARTRVEVTMTSPRWQRPGDVDPAVEVEWERFAEALHIHELGHVTIALQGADTIDDRFDHGLTATTCEEAREAADEQATRIFDHYSKLSRRYDRATDHGLSQGTGLGG